MWMTAIIDTQDAIDNACELLVKLAELLPCRQKSSKALPSRNVRGGADREPCLGPELILPQTGGLLQPVRCECEQTGGLLLAVR